MLTQFESLYQFVTGIYENIIFFRPTVMIKLFNMVKLFDHLTMTPGRNLVIVKNRGQKSWSSDPHPLINNATAIRLYKDNSNMVVLLAILVG